MKNFQDFINEIKNAVNFEGIVEQITVTKSNGRELTGLTFRKTKNSIAPTVYMNDYFEAYQNGTDIDDIVKKVEEILDMEVPDFDISALTDWDQVKDLVMPFVIDKNLNKELLENLVSTPTGTNLVECYYIPLHSSETGLANVKIHNALLKGLGVDIATLAKQAHKNALENVTIKTMWETLMGMLAPEDAGLVDSSDNFMYVVSNKNQMYGAGGMFVPEIIEAIKQKTNSSEFYILPSSIHEILVVTDISSNVENLLEMVKSVNDTQVSLEDKLSDAVYKYDGDIVIQVA